MKTKTIELVGGMFCGVEMKMPKSNDAYLLSIPCKNISPQTGNKQMDAYQTIYRVVGDRGFFIGLNNEEEHPPEKEDPA